MKCESERKILELFEKVEGESKEELSKIKNKMIELIRNERE